MAADIAVESKGAFVPATALAQSSSLDQGSPCQKKKKGNQHTR